MKKIGPKKVLLGILLLLLVGSVGVMFFKQTCVGAVNCSLGGGIEGDDFSMFQYARVWTVLSVGEIFVTLFTVMLFYGVFFLLFEKLLQVFFVNFRKKSVYQKIFFIELGLILVLAFLWFSLFVLAYNGIDCLGDDCVKASFIGFFSFWCAFGLVVLVNPTSVIVLISPYVLVSGYHKLSTKSTRLK